MAVQETQEFEEITDVPVDDHFLTELEEAGASDLLIRAVQVESGDLPGDYVNKPRLEVQKYAYWNNEVSAEVFRNYQHYGGGAFQKFWNNEIYVQDRQGQGALDPGNVALLAHLNK